MGDRVMDRSPFFIIMDLVEIDELAEFAKEHYPIFEDLPKWVIVNYFVTYQETIIIDRDESKIIGFALYQKWPDFYNFIIVCHLYKTAFKWLMSLVRNELAGKTAAWFDEKRMEPRFVKCHQ